MSDEVLHILIALIKEYERVCGTHCLNPERHAAYRAAVDLVKRS